MPVPVPFGPGCEVRSDDERAAEQELIETLASIQNKIDRAENSKVAMSKALRGAETLLESVGSGADSVRIVHG